MTKEKICGAAFEEMSEEEMRDVNGGGLELTITSWSSIPCSASATITALGVLTYYFTTK